MSTSNTCNRVYYEEVSAEKITVDRAYQRDYNHDKISRLAAEFNISAMGVPELSKRSESEYVVIDGQHRIEAGKLVGIKSFYCKVHEGLTAADEARLFKMLNAHRNLVTAPNMHRARVAAGEERAIAIQEMVDGLGYKLPRMFTMKRKCAPDTIGAVGTLYQVYDSFGVEVLRQTLSLIRETWPNDGDALLGKVIEGVAVFVNKHHGNENFRKDRFVGRLNRIPASTIYRRAASRRDAAGGSLPHHLADILVEEYNRNTKARLQRLYLVTTAG